MALSKMAVTAFKERVLENHDWLKEVHPRALMKEAREIGAVFHTKPRPEQLVSFLLGTAYPGFMFFLEMGIGKTKISLDLISHHQRWEAGPALVLVPNALNITDWAEQIQIHAPHLKCVELYGSTEQRWEALRTTTADVFVINYAGVSYLASTKQEITKGPKKGKKKLQVDKKRMSELCSLFDILILDESTEIKGRTSLIYECCRSLSNAATYRYGLTGTPFGRDLQDLWPQFHVVDRGETLGPTVTLYREAFFSKKKGYFGGYDYTVTVKGKATIREAIKHRSIRYTTAECQELPPLTKKVIHVPANAELKRYHDEAIKSMKRTGGNYVESKNSFMRARQLCSGFGGVRDEETGEKIEFEFAANPKLEALMGLLHQLPKESKAVIFHDFIRSGANIVRECKKLGINAVRAYGKDKVPMITKFKADKKVQILIINSKSGGKGLNLQVASYSIFYESPVSPIDRIQAERRVWRGGQEKPCFMYDLIIKGSIEQSILNFNQEGKDLLKYVLEGTDSDKFLMEA